MSPEDRIQPYVKNPFYWQYCGKPVLLIGGSKEDNLFQISDLEKHLDLLASVGGNYIRCTMSSRDEGDVWPFDRDSATGLYDLDRPGLAYWSRFEKTLALTAERDIVLQIELWDRFDFIREPWQKNPYNPQNNINYTAEESGLKHTIDTHPGKKENAFFRTVPALLHNDRVLYFQQRHVDQLLSLSLPYGNVLYCIDNETNESPEWGAYWAHYIQRRAVEMGVNAAITEMWDAWNLLDGEHAATFDNPELYTFVDISQNNHQPANHHWANPQEIRRRLETSGRPRPMNSVKIYGANSGHFGSTRDAQERFWRNIFGGLASSRFHRPPAGLGLSEIPQSHLKSMRMFTTTLDIFSCKPDNALLNNRSWNEAYCTANPGVQYAVFFPDGGNINLDVSAASGKSFNVRWFDIRSSSWMDENKVEAFSAQGWLPLITPCEEGYWAVLVSVV